jgi:hypothetical protein
VVLLPYFPKSRFDLLCIARYSAGSFTACRASAQVSGISSPWSRLRKHERRWVYGNLVRGELTRWNYHMNFPPVQGVSEPPF